MKFIKTRWEKITYDVWGNQKDGWEVNDLHKHGEIELTLTIETFNRGTPQEFQAAHPTKKQLRKVFGIPRIQIEALGDDMQINIERNRDGYPVGELRCVSHSSLSPIKPLDKSSK